SGRRPRGCACAPAGRGGSARVRPPHRAPDVGQPRRVALAGAHLVRRARRAYVPRRPRRERGQAPGGQDGCPSEPRRRHARRGRAAAAPARSLSRVLERRRAGRAQEGRELLLPGQVIAAFVRGLVLLSLASAIGGLVLGLLFPASAAPDLDVARARLRRWVPTCLVILLLATWAELLVRTQAMSGASLGAVVPRFSRLARLSLLAVVVTGSYTAWTQLGGVSRLWTTMYGRVLIAKLLIVAVLVWLGAVNRYAHLPRLAPSQAAPGVGARAFRMARLAAFGRSRGTPSAPAESRLVAYVTGEALVGLAVFACTAVLSEVTPGRHVTFERK